MIHGNTSVADKQMQHSGATYYGLPPKWHARDRRQHTRACRRVARQCLAQGVEMRRVGVSSVRWRESPAMRAAREDLCRVDPIARWLHDLSMLDSRSPMVIGKPKRVQAAVVRGARDPVGRAPRY